MQTETLDNKTLEGHKAHFIAGHGGYPLVGTAEQITPTIASNSHTVAGWLHSALGSNSKEIIVATMAPKACWPQANAAGFVEAM